jgi:hypothetical protein
MRKKVALLSVTLLTGVYAVVLVPLASASGYGCGRYGSHSYQTNCSYLKKTSSASIASVTPTGGSGGGAFQVVASRSSNIAPQAPINPRIILASAGPIKIPAGRMSVGSAQLPITGSQFLGFTGTALISFSTCVFWSMWYRKHHAAQTVPQTSDS